ncbi:YdeI/OmpD-associated family protein [Mucilaginibacter sp. PAMB04274]|uniref:YdeI/OmpD-associated family protein n=1 Tax=Mucilaginibacter sp. PAMB04274 TaxID=3138568 RepID=UPI0031F6501A
MSAVAKKLLMKSGQHWLLYNAPNNYLPVLEPLPESVQVSYVAQGSFHGIQLFVLNSAELAAALQQIVPLLKAETIFWIIYPKKSSGIATDLAMMSNWAEPEKHGLGSVAAAAIDATWTALRFRPKVQSKVSPTRNSELSANEFGAYIDAISKTVTLPPDVETALKDQPAALNHLMSLSYSNKKEYVLWIVTAKQEKTRTERLNKMIEKLLSGKKNPSEK